jgi:hypothetical protein
MCAQMHRLFVQSQLNHFLAALLEVLSLPTHFVPPPQQLYQISSCLLYPLWALLGYHTLLLSENLELAY